MPVKRSITFFLALCFLLLLLPFPDAEAATYQGVSYSADCTAWKQTDDAWGSLPLGKSGYTMEDSGCLVTAIAIQICRAKVYNPTQLNPGTLLDWLNDQNAFSSTGNLQFTKMNLPRFSFSGEKIINSSAAMTDICSKAADLQRAGNLVIARVGSRTGRTNHFVAVGSLRSNDGVIYDPAGKDSQLSAYKGTITGLLYFKPNANARDTIFSGEAIPWSNVTNTNTTVTVVYNANGGNLSPISQTVQPGSDYNLPIPTRKNAAFLGWYTSTGSMVTSKVSVPNTNHTLTARWDLNGHSFSRINTYHDSFADVSPKEWYYSSVANVYAYGLMNGSSDTTFEPKEHLSYLQAITMAARVNKQYREGNMLFPQASPWYTPYTQYALSHDILSEIPENANDEITRQEYAALLSMALPSSALPKVNNVEDGAIPDVYRSDSGIYRLYRAGVFAGNSAKGEFLPNNPITRAEAAAVLVRLADPTQRILFTLSS